MAGTHLDAERCLVRLHRLEDVRDVHGAVGQQEAERQAGAGQELRGGAQRALDERLRGGQRRIRHASDRQLVAVAEPGLQTQLVADAAQLQGKKRAANDDTRAGDERK